MKTKTRSRSRCTIKAARWASYAIAGAATAMAANNDAEAAILYSGTLNQTVGAGASARPIRELIANSNPNSHGLGYFRHLANAVHPATFGEASFHMNSKTINTLTHNAHAAAAGQVRGFVAGAYHYAYASKLASGANIPVGPFNAVAAHAVLNSNYPPAFTDPNAEFKTVGIGFVAFEFNLGTGEQYGWARVNMTTGSTKNSFKLVDYAYGTIGQAITVGQEFTPEPATLALLALGAAGLFAARLGGKRKAVPAVN